MTSIAIRGIDTAELKPLHASVKRGRRTGGFHLRPQGRRTVNSLAATGFELVSQDVVYEQAASIS